MTSVLDASAVLAILLGEPGAQAATEAAATGTITSINLAEVRDRMVRVSRDRGRVVRALDALVDRGLQVTGCHREMAEQAADLRSEHYDGRQLPISLADCCAIAAAAKAEATLVSSDRDQLRVALRVGVTVLPIADSTGVVPDVGRFSR